MTDHAGMYGARRAGKLIGLAACLNGALGSRKYDQITIDEVKQAIEGRTLFEYLEAQLGRQVEDPLSVLNAQDRYELLEEWMGLMSMYDQSEKLCVQRNGLCLLVAYLLESIVMCLDEPHY